LKADAELEPFARLVEALELWLKQTVVIGGWAHRLYRLAQKLTYPPLTTLDSDVAVPAKIDVKGKSIREYLLAAGFREEFVGEDRPPATRYHLGAQGGPRILSPPSPSFTQTSSLHVKLQRRSILSTNC
jgi:hypothetical protein